MAALDSGTTSGDDEAARAARLAAMARAAQGATGPAGVAGDTGPGGPGSGAPAYGTPTKPTGYSDPNDLLAGPGGSTKIAEPPHSGPVGATGPTGPAGPSTPPTTAALGSTGAPGGGTYSGPGPDAMTRARDLARSQAGVVGAAPAPTPQAVATAPSTIRGISAPPAATSGGSMAPVLTPTAPAPQPTGTISPIVNAPGPIQNQNPNPTDTSGGANTGTSGGLQQLTGSIVSQIQQMQQGLASPGTPSDATAVFLKQSQAILGMLDQQEAQLRADAEKQGTQVDPATQFTIDKLRQTLEENLKSTRESLNSRGLYDSGIELELENRLQKGSASDQAMVLADRLSKLQADLSAGLTQIRTQRYSTVNQFGMAAANAQTTSDENGRKLAYDREQSALQAMLNLRGQQSSEAQAAAARQQAASQFSAGQSQQAALATQAQNAQAQLAAAQRAFEAAQNEANRNSTAANQANAQAAARALADANNTATAARQAASDAAAAARQTTATGATNAAATSGALKTILGSYEDAGTALAVVQANAAQLQAQGVDIAALNAAIKNALPVAEGSSGSAGMR